MTGNLELKPIGYVKSCFRDRFGAPRQPGLVPNSDAVIEILPPYQPLFSLEGLQGFSHLWLMFHFHLNKNEKFRSKVHPPRLQGETMGVFATRSPHRPNPLGLSLVEIVRVEAPLIYIQNHDLVDGTPVFDIKPYMKEIESKPEARSGWIERAEVRTIHVSWSEAAEKLLHNYSKAETFKSLIEETVRQDPRPRVYRGFEGGDSKYRDVHSVRLQDVDVDFIFHATDSAEILGLKPI